MCDFCVCKEKRFYTRGTLRSIRIRRLAKSKPFIMIGSDPWSKKRVNYLSCREGKRGGKDIHCTKSRVICWSIITYLLCDVVWQLVDTGNQSSMTQNLNFNHKI